MKVLITGKGGSGSWQIRGEQISHALDGRARPMAPLEDCRLADVIIAVKRVPDDLLRTIRQSGRPWIYDTVDAYPQPECGMWSPEVARGWLRTRIAHLKPTAVIWPTSVMQADARFAGPQAVIHHHYRPGIEINPIRPHIQAIGYEGSEVYLAEWRKPLERAAMAIGAEFVINPPSLADLDIVFAVRGRDFNGYAQHAWKSNVKLANAQGSGTPVICMPSIAYRETVSDGEVWIDKHRSIMDSIELLADRDVRKMRSERLMRKAIGIGDVVREYRKLIDRVL